MLKRIKNIINENRANQKQLFYGQNQLYATIKLQELLGEDHFIPFTGWSMSPMAILHCLNIISLKKPENIIEFGSGATTVYIAKLLKILDYKINFISVESDLNWKDKIEKQLQALDLSEYVKIVYAPLSEVSRDLTYKEQKTWYDVHHLNSVIKEVSFDFVIIDGPFGGSTPYARYSAVPFLKNNTSQNTIWVLDDTRRPQEKEIASVWKSELALNISNFDRYSILYSNQEFDYSPYSIS